MKNIIRLSLPGDHNLFHISMQCATHFKSPISAESFTKQFLNSSHDTAWSGIPKVVWLGDVHTKINFEKIWDPYPTYEWITVMQIGLYVFLI